MTMGWNEERVDLLKKLWTDGLSASQIAARLSQGVTRNAIIGKVHRLNLQGRAVQPRIVTPRTTTPREPRKPREKPTPGLPALPGANGKALVPYREKLPEPVPVRLVDLPQGGRVTILHLSDKTCKWPIGDPGSEEFCFCGHGPRHGSCYCEYHARLAYQPLQDRRYHRVAYG